MRLVERTSRARADFIFGYDWAGSTTADSRDSRQPTTAELIGGRAAVNWGDKKSVGDSYWFKGYCDAIRGEIKTLSQMPQVKTLRLICIKGGPITQLEQETILTVVEETKKDLQVKQVDADIEVVSLNFSPVDGATTGTRYVVEGCPTGAPDNDDQFKWKEIPVHESFEEIYLQPWSCQAIAQGVSRFLRSACTRHTTPAIESKANTGTDETKKSSAPATPPVHTSSNPMMEAEGWDGDPKHNVV
jgi:hypothetical protein